MSNCFSEKSPFLGRRGRRNFFLCGGMDGRQRDGCHRAGWGQSFRSLYGLILRKKGIDSSGEASQKNSDRKGLHLLSDGHPDGREVAFIARARERIDSPEKPWVILLGPITTFLDEDVPEREVRPLFERSLRKMEEMALGGIPFFLFQPSRIPLSKGDGGSGFKESLSHEKALPIFQSGLEDRVWRIKDQRSFWKKD